MALHRLHHRLDCEDIRSAYSGDKSYHSDTPNGDVRPRLHDEQSHVYNNDQGDSPAHFFQDRHPQESPHASVDTYASTVQSEEEEPRDIPEYTVPAYDVSPTGPTAVASTPPDFAELFPGHRRLEIRHDDSTVDGNMNLRVDTEVTIQGGRCCDMTLFHLRMHDLRNREFSLRRYSRDSGREVCHSERKRQKHSSFGRPSLQRSLSNALSSMRPKSDQRSPTMSSLKRNDSGYGSVYSSIDVDYDDRPHSDSARSEAQQSPDSKSIVLEFSNYAQVEIKRVGGKRYCFDYWGVQYSWKRILHKDTPSKEVSYHLTKAGSEEVLAFVVPSPLTTAEAEDEQNRGGWIPPCSMWIADVGIVRGQKDVADVVVASALMALVDDCIRARFHHTYSSQKLLIPKIRKSVEYVGPKLFRRKESGHSRQHSRPSSSSGRPSSSPWPYEG